jgi:hypothetical protein
MTESLGVVALFNGCNVPAHDNEGDGRRVWIITKMMISR